MAQHQDPSSSEGIRSASFLDLTPVLEEEFQKLHKKLPEGFPGETADPGDRRRALFREIHKLNPFRSALCLSGGGIRSATFALGLLQGLARHGLLRRFDYLSTVSGGGYIGSWLSAWIAREGAERVEGLLGGSQSDHERPEPAPVRHLRAYSNYLTPKLGVLSADTWTLIATLLRNLLLNWLLLLPILGVLMMVPRIWLMLLSLPPGQGVSKMILGVSVFFFILGSGYIFMDLPNLGNRRGSQRKFFRWCLVPLLLAAFGVATFWAWFAPEYPYPGPEERLSRYVVIGALVHPASLLLGLLGLRRAAFRLSFLVPALLTGALGGLGTWALVAVIFPYAGTNLHAGRELPMYAVFAPVLCLLLGVFCWALLVGLTSRVTKDEDREWLSRAGAWVLISIVVWTVGAAISVFGPAVPLPIAGMVALAGCFAGSAVAVFSFRTGRHRVDSKRRDPEAAGLMTASRLRLATSTFVLALLMVVSILTSRLLGVLTPVPDLKVGSGRFWTLVYGLGFTALLFLLAMVMRRFLQINEFSLHSMYRNRLVRAYLGASRLRTDANLFTGFAGLDDLPVADLSGQRPFHVLNLTLNVVNANNLAWQERKAEPFTVSPLHAGSRRLGYRPADRYAGGITLGTAATISGAAASPNMGCHSSPAVTFLMTFFNARLGCWLGNPGHAGWRTWWQAGPRSALGPMVSEALGRTDNQAPYVYLSDGGHFENLGLYEMVLRRCRLIVVSDAGCDSRYAFGDLGNAVRKIRVDLGIPIEFRGRTLSQATSGDEAKYGALADIRYSCVDDPDAPDGLLIYLKPSLNGTEPADIQNYKVMHPDFPHEATSNQWFAESQFESYRMLGSHIIEEICGTVRDDLAAFREKAEAYLGSRAAIAPAFVPRPSPDEVPGPILADSTMHEESRPEGTPYV